MRDISTSLKESVKHLTEELRESANDLRETLQGGLQKLNDDWMDALGKIQQGVMQINTEEPLCPRSLGLSSYKPAKSCREILRCNPSSPSGYYWLKSATTECREVYCDMDTTHCNITGGWMRLAYSHYVDGVSITYGTPRRHIWTYASGLSDDGNNNNGVYNCPCAKYPGDAPPPLLGLLLPGEGWGELWQSE